MSSKVVAGPEERHLAIRNEGEESQHSANHLGISRQEFVARQDAVRVRARQAGYDALVVIGRSFYDRCGDLAYLSNHFPAFPATVFSEHNRGMGHAFLLLPVDSEPTLITDPRRHREDLVAVTDVRSSSDLGKATIALLRQRDLDRGRIGLVGDDILPATIDREIARELPDLALEAAPRVVSDLRARKSAEELKLLRRAALCADAGLRASVDQIATLNPSERTTSAAGIAASIRAGADFVRYLRVHSGHWSAAGSRWPPATDRVIENGDVVALDIIGAHQGYQFDVNRTTVKGTPSSRVRSLLDAVESATRAAVERCLAGTPIDEVVAAATRSLVDRGFGSYVGPMIGHGIGLETVEEPYLQANNQEILEPGMVLCVEPGVFIPGWAGAAIEQEIIVRQDGPPEVITPTPTILW